MDKKRKKDCKYILHWLPSFFLSPSIPINTALKHLPQSKAFFNNGVTSSYFFYYLRWFFCFYWCSVIPNRLKVKEQSSVFIVFISPGSSTIPDKQQLFNAKWLTFIQFSHYVSASACLQPSQSTYWSHKQWKSFPLCFSFYQVSFLRSWLPFPF